jgi:hypothetical protein
MLVFVGPSSERSQSTYTTFEPLLSTVVYLSSSELCAPTYICLHIAYFVSSSAYQRKENIRDLV